MITFALFLYEMATHNKIAIYQDTRSCVMRPRSGARDTVCYLLEPQYGRNSIHYDFLYNLVFTEV